MMVARSSSARARLRRAGLAAAVLAASVTGLAALLQWFWAGWDVYAGPGPSLGMRWLLTGTMGAAVLLPMGAVMVGAAVGRRLADPALREQLRVTRSGVVRAALLASAWAIAPLLLAVVLSAIGWTLVAFVDAGRSRFPSPLAIWLAHTLVLAIGAAFAVWGLALSVGTLPRVPAALLVPPAAYCLLAAGPALVGPLLPHLARPERALDATLLVNPITAVAAALGMDILRSPRVYGLTRAPEYWYVYPPSVAVAAVYIAAAGLGAQQLRRRLGSE